jgi:hypothetical protein
MRRRPSACHSMCNQRLHGEHRNTPPLTRRLAPGEYANKRLSYRTRASVDPGASCYLLPVALFSAIELAK